MKGKISEIFYSVQGEGVYLGEKQLFVRFFGCNLECKFCDTKLNFFKEYEPQELFEELNGHDEDFHSISFTGGEPLLQKDFLKELLQLTSRTGYKIFLETNGTLPGQLKEVIEYVDIVSMDIKLPSSTGQYHFWEAHRSFLKIASQKELLLKIVICKSTEESDFLEAIKLIKDGYTHIILVLQPNSFDYDDAMAEKLQKFKDICACESVTACVIPQMHKIVGIK